MDIVDLHRRALRQFGALVDATAPASLDSPTPCAEWDVRQLLRHVIGGNVRWAESAEGRPFDMSGSADDDVADDALRGRYHETADMVDTAWRQPGRLERGFPSPMGETTGRDRVWQHVVEVVVHGCDLARATNQRPGFDDDVVAAAAEFAHRNMPEQRPEGFPFAAALEVTDDAPAIDRLAAFMGRPA